MCMVLRRNSRQTGKIARKNLFCWKYFRRMDERVLSTPVYESRVREEDGYIMTPDQDEPDIWHGVAYGGVIHAARCDCAGLEYINENITGECPVVALMVIPKGTRYWVGTEGCVCAERMEYLQTYKSTGNNDVGHSVDGFALWYDEMWEWLVDNDIVY